MKSPLPVLALPVLFLLGAAHDASAACAQKRSRDVSFVELAVPEEVPDAGAELTLDAGHPMLRR